MKVLYPWPCFLDLHPRRVQVVKNDHVILRTCHYCGGYQVLEIQPAQCVDAKKIVDHTISKNPNH
jgi:hypothetical protein